MTVGRTLNEIIEALPKRRRARIEVRYRKLKDEVEGLQELRQVAGKAQADIAATLKIKQPSVSKIEKQTDLYLSTLRNYVEALGGELELVVRLPSRRALRIRELGMALERHRTHPVAAPNRPTRQRRRRRG
jgi:hypothetical protein